MRRIIIFKLLFLLTISVKAQSQPSAPAFVSDSLTSISKDFIKKNPGSPGFIVRVSKPYCWDWSFANGINDISSNTLASPELVFRAASISKLFCATAILQLASKGELSLDDKMGLWFSKNYISKLRNGDKITVKNLLQHTSGLYEPQAGINFLEYPDKDYSNSILSIVANQEQSFNYGECFYSGANYNLLAEIVKIVSGMSYKEYLTKQIFKPLGLNDTYVNNLPDAKYFNGYIPGYNLPNSTAENTNILVNYSHANMSWAPGAADISSSTKDLIRFYSALNQGEILPEEWVKSMILQPVTPAYKQKYSKYGYGTMIFDDGFAIGHTGNAAGYTNLLCKITKGDIYVCISMNRYFMPFNGLKEYLSGIEGISNH